MRSWAKAAITNPTPRYAPSGEVFVSDVRTRAR